MITKAIHIKRYNKMKVNASLFSFLGGHRGWDHSHWRSSPPGGLPGPPTLDPLAIWLHKLKRQMLTCSLLKHQSGHRALASTARGHVGSTPLSAVPHTASPKAFTCIPSVSPRPSSPSDSPLTVQQTACCHLQHTPPSHLRTLPCLVITRSTGHL